MTENKIKTSLKELPNGKKRAIKLVLGALAGAVLGYGYYAIIGCSTGGCAITSDPLISTAWGALIGGLAAA